MNYDFIHEGVELVETCGGCPEQYDAYKNDVCVGYLRLRHGVFTVDTDCGQTILTAYPKGDGVFEYEEREHYLKAACALLNVCS